MTIRQVFCFAAGVFRHWNHRACQAWTDSLELPMDRRVKELSRGESAKLDFILAVSHEPDLLILDEPTTGLDAVVRGQLLDAVATLVRERGLTVLFSTHVLSDVDQIADLLVVLNQGRVLAAGSVEELRSRYIKASFVFRTESPDSVEIPQAIRVHRGLREWVAIFNATDAVDLAAIAARIGAADVLERPLSAEELFIELFAQTRQSHIPIAVEPCSR
jgi:ABC-2 type transport system ATP-binding protein